MVIRASSGRQVDALVVDLGSSLALTREAAIARLTVIGARAVDRLIELVASGAPPVTRASALRALEAIADPRSLPAASRAARDPDAAVATPAVGVLRSLLAGPPGVESLDALTGIALDRELATAVRAAAIHALVDLPRSTVEPIWTALRDDPAVAAQVPRPGRSPRDARHAETLAQAARGELPDPPAALRQALAHAGGNAPLTLLHAIVERLSEREAHESVARRDAWRVARGAAHAILAERRSRLAVYDLKETLERADAPLPVEFLAALGGIGDASCLEAIASAYMRAGGAKNDWWRAHLADAFRAIVKREKLTRRSAALKRIAKRWPGALADLLPTRPT